jgi:hypothetical protein
MLKFKRYRLPKNKKYKYIPRYSSNKPNSSHFKGLFSKHSFFDEHENNSDKRAQWAAAREFSRNRGNREINVRLIVIIAILMLITLWVFDFDLSIFSIRK